MILIFNGMLGTNIDNIASNVSLHINSNAVTHINLDSNNSLEVYKTHNNEIIPLEEYMNSLEFSNTNPSTEEINYLNHTVRSQHSLSLGSHFLNSYYYDIGMDSREIFLEDFPDFKVNKPTGIKDYSPSEIRKKYEESKLVYFVISGQIGKNYIDEIIKEFGEKNVQVYNIKRHPAVSHTSVKLLKKYNDSCFKNFLYHIDMLNTEFLSKQKNVTTYKFEDLMKDNFIEINNIKIELPKDYKSDYEYLTQFEVNDNFFMESLPKMENFENMYISEDLRISTDLSDTKKLNEYILNTVFNKTEKVINHDFIKNYIKDLGYTPLKINELLNLPKGQE